MSKFFIELCAILTSYQLIYAKITTTVEPTETPEAPETALDFEGLTKCSTFVDKTLMIEIFFNHSDPWKYHLITCPRKFGKSINIDMMKRFVQIEVDDSGNVKKKEDTSSYQLFTNPSLGLQISECKTTIKDHLAEYPIIHLELHDITDSTFNRTLSNLRQKIKNCFEMYRWLYDILSKKHPIGAGSKKKSTQQEQIEFMSKALDENLSVLDIPNSLDILSKILYEYFKKKIFVFVDEYDIPIVDAITKDLDFDIQEIINLISEMVQRLLKTSKNNYVEYAFISGITNTMVPLFIAKTKRVYYHRFLNDHVFSPYYGLIQQEVDDLLERHNYDAEAGKEVIKFYKGYSVKEMVLDLYNTYSITSYLTQVDKNVSFPAFWAESGSIDFLKKFTKDDDVYDKLSHLVLLKEVQFKLIPCVDIELLKVLFAKTQNTYPAQQVDVNVIFSYLFESGYLSYTAKADVYTIPNQEIETAFSFYLFDFYGKNLGPEAQSVGEELKRILDTTQVTRKMLIKLKTLLQNLIPKAENLISSHVEKEFHYHSLIYYSAKKFHAGTSAEVRMLCEDSKLAPNTKKIKRRADIVMVNQDKTVMMIIEIKSNLTARNALEVAQMYKPSEDMDKPKIIKYMGINFKRNMSEVGYTYDIVRDSAIFADDM
ncbi:uncharacterized protein LOC135843841 [Planococcus citri]|uniref:uncharacterized protein LOC135843841 n=1 Tax=Planococcus citri TaxID=170843 RepID=UPI0031F92B16